MKRWAWFERISIEPWRRAAGTVRAYQVTPGGGCGGRTYWRRIDVAGAGAS